MTTAESENPEKRKRRGAVWLTFGTAGLGALLAVGTTVGLVSAVNSSSEDRVQPSSTAPVYGSR
jgi:hypothetical protein